jgi:hypothetical protein
MVLMNGTQEVDLWGGLTRSGSPSEILSEPLVDGIYEVHFGQNILYMRVKNCQYIDNYESLLFCLNAAVSARNRKKPPYFSGNKLSDSLKCCIISFSDPSTHLKNIDLGWYIGNEDWLSFQQDLSLFIEQCSLVLKKKIILFGGSGGGFASIALSLKIKNDVMSISMNPQLNISAYPSANKYSTNAFPSSNISDVKTFNINLKEWLEFFDKNQLITSIMENDLNQDCDYLLLQSWNDTHHLRRHAPQLIPQILDLSLSNFYGTSKNLSYFFGPWGDRHSVVWVPHLELILNSALMGESAEKIITRLAEEFLPEDNGEFQSSSEIKFPPQINLDSLERGFPLIRYNFSTIPNQAFLENSIYGLNILESLLRQNQRNLDVFVVFCALKCWHEAREIDDSHESKLWAKKHFLDRIKVLEYLCEEFEKRPALRYHATVLEEIVKQHLTNFELLKMDSNVKLENWLIKLQVS